MSVAEKMASWAVAHGIGELHAVTLDTRSRLNDLSIGTQVNKGRFRVVRTVYDKTTTTVTPLSDWLVPSDAIVFLKMLKADTECLRRVGGESG
jgi:D-tyrosyl-tRNA(Tyr) deacylase